MSEVNPYAPPVVRGGRNDSPDGEFEAPEGEYGGIGRLAYFGYSFLIGIVQNILVAVLAAAAGPETGGILGLFVILISLGFSIWVIVQRLKNMGYSGWWTIGMFVPILNILVGLRCIAAPEGYADHKTLDKNGKIVMGIFIGFILLAVVAVVIAIAAGN